ncbi:hypothetical protein NB693_22795 [Pantoea ananatis]|uniref:hypothetical protein n=1 Tax=Pantoea ananas TaxID=553 RepID=UPI00221E5AF1|nr:hypothetical protein [Pantoea ananatis]
MGIGNSKFLRSDESPLPGFSAAERLIIPNPRPMHILLAYASLSGNTRDVARRVHAQCEAAGHEVTWIHTDLQTLQGALGDAARAADFDLHLLGSWSAGGDEALYRRVGRGDRQDDRSGGVRHRRDAVGAGVLLRGGQAHRAVLRECSRARLVGFFRHQTRLRSMLKQFADALAAHPRVLADFNKDNCPGCRMLDKSLERFAEGEGTLLKVKMEDVGEESPRSGERLQPRRRGPLLSNGKGFRLAASYFSLLVQRKVMPLPRTAHVPVRRPFGVFPRAGRRFGREPGKSKAEATVR